jgi:transposase
MTRPFSKQYSTYGEWVGHTPDTSYTRTIHRLHALHPRSTLSQLRRHPQKREIMIGELKRTSVSQLGWKSLIPREKMYRERSLKVVSQMRRHGYSLSQASRLERISPGTVRHYTNAVRKTGVRWKPKAFDRIERMIAINERGRERYITVRDSRYASTIGKYHSAIRKFLETGDRSVLKPFKNKRIRDANGKIHKLETDPNKIYRIEKGREDTEVFSIYGR